MSIADYTARPTRFTIAPRGEPIFSERATTIEIDDEAGGEFIRLRQCPDGEPEAVININPEEWPHAMNEFCEWRTPKTQGLPEC